MRVEYTASNYPRHFGPALNGAGVLNVSWGELVWASLTVGRQGWRDVFKNGRYSLYEAVFRVALVYANLRQNRRGILSRTSAYCDLDPSEKSGVSYFLGLSLAHLMCSRLFGVAWLMHLDCYRSILDPVLVPGRQRPDLVGLNLRRDWIVVEAKGRSNRMASRDLGRAKSQTRKLRKVAGAYPFLRCAMVTHFKGNSLHVDTVDPEGFEKDAKDVDLDLTDFLLDYYSPIRDLFESGLPAAGREDFPDGVRGCSISGFDVSIGIPHGTLDALKAPKNPERVLEAVRKSAHSEAEEWGKFKKDPLAHFGSDGIAVRLGPSWEEKLMMFQPEKRGR